MIRDRTVVVDYTFRVIRTVPEDWDEGSIEFHLNEGSWCADNAIRDLERMHPDHEGISNHRCSCDRFAGAFVREATEEDESRYGREATGTSAEEGDETP